MRKIIVVILSAALAIPGASLMAQQSTGTTQKPAQVSQAESGAAGTGPSTGAAGAGAATSAAIAGIGLAGLIAIGVAVVFTVAAVNANDDNPVTPPTSTR